MEYRMNTVFIVRHVRLLISHDPVNLYVYPFFVLEVKDGVTFVQLRFTVI